jgi:hypothetical protein
MLYTKQYISVLFPVIYVYEFNVYCRYCRKIVASRPAFDPEDGGRLFLRNIDIYLLYYMLLYSAFDLENGGNMFLRNATWRHIP